MLTNAEKVLTAANRCVTIHVDHIAVLVRAAINLIMMATHVEVRKLIRNISE